MTKDELLNALAPYVANKMIDHMTAIAEEEGLDPSLTASLIVTVSANLFLGAIKALVPFNDYVRIKEIIGMTIQKNGVKFKSDGGKNENVH